jgi:NitT/TauT family transport system substrate-binding protein
MLTLMASAVCRPALAAPSRRLTVGALLLTPSAGFFIASEKGYCREAGIEVVLKPFTNAQQIAVAVVSGDLDIGLTGITAGLYNLAGKGGLRIIGATAREERGYHLNAYLATNAAYAAGLRSVADLKGKRIGMTTVGSTGHYSIGLAARKYGIDLATIHMIPLQTIPNLQAAFQGGQLDGVVIPVAAAGQLTAEGAGHVIGWVGDETPWQTNAILTSPNLVAADRSVVQRFITTYQRGAAEYAAAFNARDPAGDPADGSEQRALLTLLSHVTGETSEHLRFGLPYIDPRGYMLVQDLRDQVTFWKRERLADDDVNLDDFLDLSFIGQTVPPAG